MLVNPVYYYIIIFSAPEVIKNEGNGKPVDWWGLGTLM